jgi:hypothetical protein
MFTKKTEDDKPTLETAIDDVLSEMRLKEPDEESYSKMADQLVKLYELKKYDISKKISAETWATIGAHLGGILLIVGHERANVVTSKAIGFVTKLFK